METEENTDMEEQPAKMAESEAKEMWRARGCLIGQLEPDAERSVLRKQCTLKKGENVGFGTGRN